MKIINEDWLNTRNITLAECRQLINDGWEQWEGGLIPPMQLKEDWIQGDSEGDPYFSEGAIILFDASHIDPNTDSGRFIKYSKHPGIVVAREEQERYNYKEYKYKILLLSTDPMQCNFVSGMAGLFYPTFSQLGTIDFNKTFSNYDPDAIASITGGYWEYNKNVSGKCLRPTHSKVSEEVLNNIQQHLDILEKDQTNVPVSEDMVTLTGGLIQGFRLIYKDGAGTKRISKVFPIGDFHFDTFTVPTGSRYDTLKYLNSLDRAVCSNADIKALIPDCQEILHFSLVGSCKASDHHGNVELFKAHNDSVLPKGNGQATKKGHVSMYRAPQNSSGPKKLGNVYSGH